MFVFDILGFEIDNNGANVKLDTHILFKIIAQNVKFTKTVVIV